MILDILFGLGVRFRHRRGAIRVDTMKLFALCLLLTACTTTPRHYPIQVRQTLLYGSDASVQQGCVRGVIRWHHFHTGSYPTLLDVALFCEDVRRSFEDEIGKGDGRT